jgi:hypothetical protein
MISMKGSSYLLDTIALAVLTVMIAIVAAFVPPFKVPKPLWIGIYFAWAAGALFFWYKVEICRKRWFLIAASSVGGAVFWYLTTRAISRFIFGDGESEPSKAFDIIVALIISPGLTLIAIAGGLRESIQRKLTRSLPP